MAALALFFSSVACKPPTPHASLPIFLVDGIDSATAELDENRFRSLVRDARRSDHVKLGDETRSAFFGPAPSRIEFAVTLPQAPILHFGLGIAAFGESVAGGPVRFRVRISTDGSEGEVVFEESLRRRAQWVDRTIELPEWSNREVRLTFETEWVQPPNVGDDSPGVLPLWGSPILTSREPMADRRPHLFLVSIDCLRADHLGAYGYASAATPNLDRFAEDAIVYERAVATSAWTLPTHMSMMTGLTPSFHGATTPSRPVDDDETLLAELLRASGYETVGLVTWWFVSQAYGFDRGFDLFGLRSLASAEDIVDEAVQRIRAGAAHEQFVFLHLLEPHWEYDPPPARLEALGPRPGDVSRLLEMADTGTPDPTPTEVEEMMRLYDAEISTADAAIGRFFDELKALGLYEDAAIIVTADHGEAFFEHRGWQHDALYEEVTHVPLVVKYPRGKPGRVSHPVSQTRIFSTLLDLAGLTLPTGAPDSLRDASDASPDRATPIVSEYEVAAINRRHGRAPVEGTSRLVAVRQGPLKYIVSLGPAQGAEAPAILHEELYDLEADPGETDNVALERPREREELSNVLRAYLRSAARDRDREEGSTLSLEGEMLRDLETLGYVTPERK